MCATQHEASLTQARQHESFLAQAVEVASSTRLFALRPDSMRLLRHRTQASAFKHDSARLFELRPNSVSHFLFSQNSMQLLLFAGDWIRLAPHSTRLCSLRSDSTKGYSPKSCKLIFWILYAAQKLYISKHFPYSKVTILGSPCGGVHL